MQNIAEKCHFHAMQINAENIFFLAIQTHFLGFEIHFIGLCAYTMRATQDLSGGSIPTEPQISTFQLSPELPRGNLTN